MPLAVQYRIIVTFGSFESTQEPIVALDYRLEQLLRFLRVFQAFHVHRNSIVHSKELTNILLLIYSRSLWFGI